MRLAISNALSRMFRLATSSSSVESWSNKLCHLKSRDCYRFTLHKGEVFRFPSACRELHVLSGAAWITVGGEDIILTSDKKALLPSNKDFAIISPLGNIPLILKAF